MMGFLMLGLLGVALSGFLIDSGGGEEDPFPEQEDPIAPPDGAPDLTNPGAGEPDDGAGGGDDAGIPPVDGAAPGDGDGESGTPGGGAPGGGLPDDDLPDDGLPDDGLPGDGGEAPDEESPPSDPLPEPPTDDENGAPDPVPPPPPVIPGVLIRGNDGSEFLFGGVGNDTIVGGGGNDLLEGGGGDDLLISTAGNDSLAGFEGGDTLLGGPGNNLLLGEGGDDLLFAGEGYDTLRGGDGGDLLIAGVGSSVLEGDTGDDTQVGGRSGSAVQPNILSGGVGDDAFVVYHNQFARVDVGSGSNIVVIELSGGLVAETPLATTQIAGFDGVLDALVFVQTGPEPVPVVSADVVTASAGDVFGFAPGAQYTLVRLDGQPGAVLAGALPDIAAEITVTPQAEARGLLGILPLAREDFLVA